MANNDALHRIRRFYKTVGMAPAKGGFQILLDGRKAKTPDGALLVLPTAASAALVAAEWEAQAEFVHFATMPASRHAFTAIDRVARARDETAAELARFAGSDALCYFAPEPQALLARQQAAWTPLLEWAHEALGLTMVRASGIVFEAQPPQTLARANALAAELDDFALAGLAWASALFGSSVLAFALQRGRIGGEEAYGLSRLDEAFQEEQWGVDDEAAARTANLHAEALLLERWFVALR